MRYQDSLKVPADSAINVNWPSPPSKPPSSPCELAERGWRGERAINLSPPEIHPQEINRPVGDDPEERAPADVDLRHAAHAGPPPVFRRPLELAAHDEDVVFLFDLRHRFD